MKRRDLLLAGAGSLVLSIVLNLRWLRSYRLDMDSLNAMTVFFLGRVDLIRVLRWLASSAGTFSSYEPVTNFSYWLIYDLLKASGPSGFRWFEVVLQAADALLVGWLATRWVQRSRWAALAGLLYLLHPMHENWSCMGVPHYLATLFILCALLLHSRTGDPGSGRRTAGLCALYLLAAFSKESGVLLPLFLLCFDASVSIGAPSRAEFWRKRLTAYLGLAAVALFYVWVRWDLLHAGVSAGAAVAPGRRLWEALSASRSAAVFPAALVMLLLARKHASAAHFARFAFCAAWFVIAVLPFLGLLPVRLPAHVSGIDSRYLFLPLVGLAWLTALTLDLCERRWGRLCAAVLALLALAPSLAGLSRLRSDHRQELASIEQGLARCADPLSPNWACVQAAISLPLVRRDAPEEYARLAATVNGLWPRRRAEDFLGFFSPQPFDGAAPKWRCLGQTLLERGELEDCVKADSAFAAGAFHAATGSWPSFTEAYFQQARELSAARDEEGAARSYDRARRSPMAYYLLPALTARSCAAPHDDSCRFLDRAWSGDLFRDTGRTYLGAPPARAEGPAPDRERLERMARLYQDASDYASAVRVLDRLIEDFPFDARYWNDRGVARLLLKDDAAALLDLEKAVAADPDLLSASLTLGGIHMSRGRKDKALKVYAAALRRPVRRGEPADVRRRIREAARAR